MEICQLRSALLPFCSAGGPSTQCGLEFGLRARFSTSLCPGVHVKGHHVLGMCSSPQPMQRLRITHFSGTRFHLRWQGELHNSHSPPHLLVSQPSCFVPYSPRTALAASPSSTKQRMSSLQQHPTLLPQMHEQGCSDCFLH